MIWLGVFLPLLLAGGSVSPPATPTVTPPPAGVNVRVVMDGYQATTWFVPQ